MIKMIRAENLKKKFREVQALNGISFEVKEGEIFGYLGPNGAGKTTTIRILSALIRPDFGYAEVCGINVQENPTAVLENIGVLPENNALYERLTGREILIFFAKAYNIPREEANRRINELLKFFGLKDRADDPVGKYSKGMKQRLALIRTVLHRPKVLLLDEPTSGLSPEIAIRVRDLIKKLAEKEDVTIFLSTHNLDEAERLCDRVAVIFSGKILLIGSPSAMEKEIKHVIIRLRKISEPMINALKEKAIKFHISGEQTILLEVKNYSKEVPEVIKILVLEGAEILSVEPERKSLWDIYMEAIRGE
ncbi:MAG: ABC transporter ATP-binding protein [Candidatus Korarchaeota archaeon]|nr:ABC transporter ATP-binding protein [Candidatus Korarchaeota archaeon]